MMDMQTVVFTARIAENSYEHMCNIAEELSRAPATIVHESEEYYNVPVGRLWMKIYSNSAARLIREADETYLSLRFSPEQIEDAKKLQGMLTECAGRRGLIIKMCKRYVVGQNRIHIDKVAGLGIFVTIAVICEPDQTREAGEEILRAFQTRLGIPDEQRIIYTSYIDLLAPRNP